MIGAKAERRCRKPGETLNEQSRASRQDDG